MKQSCDVISIENEKKLFDCKALGDDEPEKLLRTVIYMLGLHLALRGGVEHYRLRRPGFDPQIKTEIDENSDKEIIIYREDPLQKTNQGGLVNKPHNKVVKVFPSADVRQCPVRIFAKYCGLLPQSKSCGKLYLRPRSKPTPAVWYCDQPYGKNKVGSTVKSICEMAGLDGKYSNHSLRAMSASRMFDDKVPEQVIKEITGHRSDCVRVYKRTSSAILEHASSRFCGIENAKSDEKFSNNVTHGVVKSESEEKLVYDVKLQNSDRVRQSLSACQIIKNVIKTRMEMRKRNRKGCVNKFAKSILKRKRQNMRKKGCKKSVKKKFVIDLNVNVKVDKLKEDRSIL